MNRNIDGVGKKIVEALKQQSDIEIQNVIDNTPEADTNNMFEDNTEEIVSDTFNTDDTFMEEVHEQAYTPVMTFTNPVPPVQEKNVFAADLDDFDVPTNVAVLKQLINQLPAGVSKQTGAQIIKQTIEAMGTSMKSVLQEAQQVQENLNNSIRECQASVMEYKKQIGVLERQSQKLQRQSSAINDIISLFVQTNI